MSQSGVPRLHLVGPLDTPVTAYPEVARHAVLGGVDAVHVRLPGAPSAEVLELARGIGALDGQALLVINDRLDVALLTGAGGVQLGERGFSVQDARRLLGPDVLIGRSVHDVAGALAADAGGANFLLAGHVFATASHPGVLGRGLDWLAEVCRAVNIPVIAIGGISAARVPAVLQTGAHGVALGREVLTAPDPAAAAHTIRSIIEEPTAVSSQLAARGPQKGDST
jgi:thiamine-phosphate pyrophosphorylase